MTLLLADGSEYTGINKKKSINDTIQEALEAMDSIFDYAFNSDTGEDQYLLNGGIAAYYKTENDPMVDSCFDSIVHKIAARNFKIISNNAPNNEVEVCKSIVSYHFTKDAHKNDLIRDILGSVQYGIQYLNTVYSYSADPSLSAYLLPWTINCLPQELFRFIKSPDKQSYDLYFRTDNSLNGLLVNDYRVLYPRQKTTPRNPYGIGKLRIAYRYVFIKQNAEDLWNIMTEDHGIPKIDAAISTELIDYMRKGEYKAKQDQIMPDLAKQLNGLRHNGTALHQGGDGKGMELKVLDSATKGEPPHQTLIKYCDEQLAILYWGHNSAAKAAPGELGTNGVPLDLMEARENSFSAFVESAINTLLARIHYINFSGPNIPTVELYDINKQTRNKIAALTARADLDIKIKQLGWERSKEQLEIEYGFKPGELIRAVDEPQPISKSESIENMDTADFF